MNNLEPYGLSTKNYAAVTCILCGDQGPETRLITRKGMFNWPTYVAICPGCGLVFLNPRWTKADYDRFYLAEYDLFYRTDETQAAAKEQRKARSVWQRLQKYTPASFTSALDIGCGLGWNLDNLAKQMPGLRIAGIEPSEACAVHFTEQIGGELIARDVDGDWEKTHTERFDLVIFRHVLEHLMDPVATLQKVAQAMAPGGMLYIAVPDMMHPDGSLSGFWFRCVHTYYFSKTTLQRAAARAALKPVTIQEEASELWGIFQKVQPGGVEEPMTNVYRQQMKALSQYRRKRLLRRVLLTISPRRLSALLPKPVKGLVPARLKDKFRSLVYRH